MKKIYSILIATILMAIPTVMKAETQTIWTCTIDSYTQPSADSPISISGTNLGNSKNTKIFPAALTAVTDQFPDKTSNTKLYSLDLGSGAMVTVNVSSNYKITSVTIGVAQNTENADAAQIGHAAFSNDGTTYGDVTAISAPGFSTGAEITLTPSETENANTFTFGRGKINNASPAKSAEFRIYYITVTYQALISGGTVTTTLTGATINGESISEADLATLIADKALTLDDAYTEAPQVSINTLNTTTFSDGTPSITEPGTAVAAINTTATNYVATATVDGTLYTITVKRGFPAQDEICGTIQGFNDFTLSSDKKTADSNINGISMSYDSKTWTSGNKVLFNGKEYTAIKSAKGNTATVTLPKNFIGKKVTFISYVNASQPLGTNYWKVNGVAHTERPMACDKDIVSKDSETPLDVQTYDLDGTSTFTFSSEGNTQAVFLIAIEMEQQATISVGGYTTFCPIYSDLTIPEGVTAYTAVLNQDGTGVVITKVNGEAIPQGCGVVLEGTAGETYTFEMAESAAAIGDNEMVGATEDIDGLANVYVLGVKNGSCVFGNWTGDTFPAGKAYLNVSPKSNQPLRLIKAEESGIEGVSVDATDNGSIYNTLGQKVDGTYKGIVIKNGGKHINR